MLPTIGFIVATYVMVRLIEIQSRSDTDYPVKVFSRIGIIIVLLLTSLLWTQSVDFTALTTKQQEDIQKLQRQLNP